jgi:putative phosphoesterase
LYKIGIISDTHGSTPNDLYEKLSGIDCILHAGDLGSPDVLLDLEVIAPVHAVCGNIDFFELSQKLPRKKIVEIGSLKFGITHGDQFKRFQIQQELIQFFQSAQVDVIVFGHTHTYYLKKHDNIWLVNPGSSNCNYSPTCIILTFENKEKLDFQLVELCQTKIEEPDDYYDYTND